MTRLAMHYPAAWVDELRARADIVEIVSGYVPLKRNGRNWWGLCPFHNEKTASFSVSQDKQMFYCFGCKAGGSVIQFIMDIERLEYNDAVAFLAERVHMTPPALRESPDEQRRKEQRSRLLEANREAARFYHEQLFTDSGKAALEYLKRRGLSDAVIRKFGLGAAPAGRDVLTKHLKSLGFTEEELRLAGLTLVYEAQEATEDHPAMPRAVRDMFRNRAIFPIIDAYGNVLAFGGRLMEGDGPKYLNTGDTPVFNKRLGVYAANLLRKERGLSRVVLVEGYMDVVSLTQFGVRGVCATLGTALTPEQARLLKRFAPRVILCYDGDEAGQHAIERGLDIFEAENIPCRALMIPGGLDPDEYIRQEGAEAFEELPAVSPADFRLQRLAMGFDLSTSDGRMEYARAAGRILAPLDPVERETLLQRLMVQTGFPRDVLLQQIGQSQPARAALPKAAVSRTASRQDESSSPMLRAQETLIAILSTGSLNKDVVDEEEFDDPLLKRICVQLNEGIKPAAIVEQQETEADRQRVSRIVQTPVGEDLNELITMARQCMQTIRGLRIQAEIDELSKQLAAMDPEAQDAARQRIAALTLEKHKLRSALSS